MPWYVIRKDFTNADTVACAFGCGQPITSGIAFVVQDANGNTGFAGRICVMGAVNYQAAIATLPDFTSATCLQNGNAGGNAGGNAAANHQVAITYLLLRFERLNYYRILATNNTPTLTNIYNTYRTNPNLPPAHVNYLLMCANNAGNYARFNFTNLMRFYCLDKLSGLISQSKHPNLQPQDINDKDRIVRDMYLNTVVPPADRQRINQILNVIGCRHRLR
ncbi:hypothetical protein CG435_23300 [Pantoea ananatis]|nr:hypothetical protein CG435_23300 [Pantoea ananatis]